jgi:glycosyltransferase involved in cell wall biosynthesis
MPRLAWFSPLPPVRSGIAAYSAQILPLLALRHEIDVFAGQNPPEGSPDSPDRTWKPASAGLHTFNAHDFLWKHDRRPYDLVIYQLGNAACHDFMWPHLARFPGLVVLHDGQLHHERSRALLSRGRIAEYRAEFHYNHPDAPQHVPDLIESTLGGSLYYLYPMVGWVVRTARLVAVHSEALAADIREAHPGVEVRTIQMGVPDPLAPASRDAAVVIRRRHQVPEGAVLFAAFGLVTPEKRISAALRGLAAAIGAGIDAYLLLVGAHAAHYDAMAEAAELGIGSRVRVTGYVPDEDIGAYLLAADVCLCLRWPTSRETSAMWVRAVAAGRPTVITDLAHTADVPSIDLRAWKPAIGAEGEKAAGGKPQDAARPAVSVAIDLLDEEASLRVAMTRLATDAGLRDRLGRNARVYWQAHHTMRSAVDDYLGAIERAAGRRAPRPRGLPAHLVDDAVCGLARRITAEFGVAVDFLGDRGLTSPEREDRLGPSAPARRS